MPRFSVCIPTRERHHTLPHAIASVLRQTHRDFEVVVQDNAGSDATYTAVKAFDDPRVKYCRSDARLPMHENWEAALNAASGEFLTFIGDDDALLPFCLDRVANLLSTGNVELLAWAAHTYYWPDVPDEKRRNHLTLDLRTARLWSESIPKTMRRRKHPTPGVFAIDCKAALVNWLTHTGFRLYVPTYHNVVSRSVIEKVKAVTGAYFFNPLPDISTLIANLYVTDEVLFYVEALSMTGHSANSSGGTHGHQEAWDARLRNFLDESGWADEDLMPSVLPKFLWNPALLVGCFEDVKRRLFPDDARFEIDWPGFVHEASGQVSTEPEAVQEQCKAWLQDCANRLGMPEKIRFKYVSPWERQIGIRNDPLGRSEFAFVDGEALGFTSIDDAVSLAHQIQPTVQYHQ